jgi:hypothetical protein
MWNEPDFPFISGDNVFGCWGDIGDAYFGGGYYAEMLKVVYPQVKTADLQGQVIIGGLLLDCDPRPGAACDSLGHSNLQPKFLEGILHKYGGAYFDGVSFHAYDHYLGTLGQYYNPNWSSAWNTTGPVFIAKTQYIQSLLSQYEASDKFIMNTEMALLCESCNNDMTFEATKAYYVVQSYAAAITQGLRANIWYSVAGWRNSGLLDEDLSPRPVYTAFRFAQSELGSAEFIAEITSVKTGGGSAIKGYEFQRGNRCIWVLWSSDGNAHLISLSSEPVAAWDALGDYVSPSTVMNVTLKPLYLEWKITAVE